MGPPASGAGKTWPGNESCRRTQQERVGRRVRSGALHRLGEIGPRSAIGVYDPFRKQVPDGLPALGLVSRKDVVKAAVFSDDHDHVFDGRCGVVVAGLLARSTMCPRSIGTSARDASPMREDMQGIRYSSFKRHSCFLFLWRCTTDDFELMLSIIESGSLQLNVPAVNVRVTSMERHVCDFAVAGSTRISPIIPPSSCSRRWQWYKNVPTVFGPRKSIRNLTLGYSSALPL